MYKVIIHWAHRQDSFSRACYDPSTDRHWHNSPRTRTHARFDVETANTVAAHWQALGGIGQLTVARVEILTCN